jgi:hypothetical protein
MPLGLSGARQGPPQGQAQGPPQGQAQGQAQAQAQAGHLEQRGGVIGLFVSQLSAQVFGKLTFTMYGL